MNKHELFENIKKKKSFLCVGLDTDIKKIPEHLLKEEDPIFAFNKAIIDAPSRPGASARAYRVQPYRQQRQDYFGQERYVP